MRKAQIQDAVRIQLAMLGYSAGHYSWPKRGRLKLLVNADARIAGDAKSDNPMPGAYVEYRMVSGMSKKAIMAIFDGIPKRGPARPLPPITASRSKELQFEAEF